MANDKWEGTVKGSIVDGVVRGVIEGKVLPPTGGGGGGDSLLTGMLAWWSMDETSGTRNDSHANSLHLTDNNTVTSAAGVVSNAARFTAANQESLSTASTTALQIGTGDFAISAWMYLDTAKDAAVDPIVSLGGSAFGSKSEGYCLYWTSSGSWTGQFVPDGTNVVSVANTTFTDTAWNHVVVNFDRTGNIMVRVNDTAETTADISAYAAEDVQCANDFFLGKLSFRTGWLNHDVDEVSLYNRLLTADEISRLYNSGSGMAYPG